MDFFVEVVRGAGPLSWAEAKVRMIGGAEQGGARSLTRLLEALRPFQDLLHQRMHHLAFRADGVVMLLHSFARLHAPISLT